VSSSIPTIGLPDSVESLVRSCSTAIGEVPQYEVTGHSMHGWLATWNSIRSSGTHFQTAQPYESAVKVLCICNDQWENLVRSLGAMWRPEECTRLARVPEETCSSAKTIHTATSESNHSYQFDVISIFKCNESVRSSKGVRR
jgi:hypothetical protein